MGDFSKFTMTREQIWAALEGRAASVEVVFQGGNDEGGVEDIYFMDADGNQIERMQEYYPHSGVWNTETQTMDYSKTEPTPDQLLSFNLCRPVYSKYYSFAGDFYVQGTLTWDVLNKQVTMDGTEEVSQYENFQETVED